MLSACLVMAHSYQKNYIAHLSLVLNSNALLKVLEPKVWLRLVKIPPHGEELADKGFENDDCFFPHFNEVCSPKALRHRIGKQCDLSGLLP